MGSHLYLLPSRERRRGVERLDAATILARATSRDRDPARMVGALTIALAEKEGIIGDQAETIAGLADQVATLAEERDAWRRAYLLATARRPLRLLPLAWAMAAHLAWVRFWGWFEIEDWCAEDGDDGAIDERTMQQ